jgi:PTH2 family peptidyl-tRNA hydrolase
MDGTMNNDKPKQMLIWRNDLRTSGGQKLPVGKIAAQMSHASLGAVLSQVTFGAEELTINAASGPLREWLDGQFTKISVYVNSEQELVDVINKAKEAGLITSLITDAGHTIFNRVPTITCGAIGPSYPTDLIGITDKLPLL